MKKLILCGICLLTVLAGCNLGNGLSKNAPSGTEHTKQYTVMFSANPAEGGTVSAKTKAGKEVKSGTKLPYGTDIVFTATPKENYMIDEWNKNAVKALQISSDKKTATLNLTADATITVTFKNKSRTTPNPGSSDSDGSKSKSGDTGKTLPDSGKNKGGSDGESNTTPNPDNNGGSTPTPPPGDKDGKEPKPAPGGETGKTYSVTFTAEPSEGGTVTAITKDGKRSIKSGDKLPENTEIIFTAMAKTDEETQYDADRWSGPANLQIADNKRTASLKLTEDAAIIVQFAKLEIEGTNWKATGMITDATGKVRNVKMIINDGGKYLTVVADGVYYGVTGTITEIEYDKTNSSITAFKREMKEEKIQVVQLFSIKLLSKSQKLPSDWEIQFDGAGDTILQSEDQPNLHIKKGTKATVTVTYNNNNQKGDKNGPFIN